MIELLQPPAPTESAALLDDVRAASRAETRAAAQRLTGIWLAKAMHERPPRLGMVFAAGDPDYRAFQTVVYRTDLITDPDTLAVRWRAREPHPALDRAFAVQVGPRGSTALSPRLTRSRFAVAKERVEDREEVIGDTGDGLATVHANVFAVDGHAFEYRLDALAATVCDADSHTKQRSRADAMGALAAGAERLGCQCGKSDCPAGGTVSAAHIVLHLVAERATIDWMSDKPDYVPSAKLAVFVRCGDLTCRAPG